MAVKPRIALVGGAGVLATEALTWILTKSGNRVIGAYPGFCELDAALLAGGVSLRAVIVDGDDPASGPSAVVKTRCAYPELKILLLCGALSPPVVGCAIEEHVEGLVVQSDSAEEVVLALRHVLMGRAVMPVGWQEASLENPRLAALSARERDVLDLLALGMSNKEIAERLVISSNTVKFHLRTIYSLLGAHNRVQAAQALCQKHGSASDRSRIADNGDRAA